ncbi:MAG: DUF2894 domain-containing protein [Hydrogenophaga sp.]|uniref:DUF2894 domain-containing protein n=1 Tax=Hydrogenophaga sp. TaxID=1904254 RepID=UPI003D113DEC
MSDVRPEPRPRSPLAELNHHIAQVAPARSELKSVQAFRESWARFATEDQVTEAVQRGPENAGPLNSHMLVLRTLGLLRELSPDYLRRFVAHADALLWLDQAGSRLKQPSGNPRAARRKR